MRRAACGLLFLLSSLTLHAARTFEVYFIDVEGGQATLMVSPSGESLLVDTGWPGFDGRDADRIVAAAKAYGLKRIDYLMITHYHRDHVGGVPQLSERIPIIHFVDHGASVETGKDADELFAAYRKVREKGRHLVVQPGDNIPIKGLEVEVLTAGGQPIFAPLDGGGATNPLCAATKLHAEDHGENARSVGILVRFGKFRLIDLGDLTWNKELELVCPINRVGSVDVYLTTHHGMDISGPAAIVHALGPRVAIMNNGSRKGGTPEAWQVVHSSPGLEDIWQLHYAFQGGKQSNVSAQFIANPEENCRGYGLMLSANSNGTFTVSNTRNGFSKKYNTK